jgi:hypothetical protein
MRTKNDTDRRADGSCEKDASLVVQHSRDRVLRHRRPRFPMSAEHRKQAQAEKSHNERNHKCARSSVTSNHNVRFDAPVRWCDDCVSPSPNNFEQNKNRARVELGRGSPRRLLGLHVLRTTDLPVLESVADYSSVGSLETSLRRSIRKRKHLPKPLLDDQIDQS